MSRLADPAWWYWFATVGLLAVGTGGWTSAIYFAIALCVVQVVHFSWRKRSVTALAVQVRLSYLGMLCAGLWEPLSFLHWIQLIGTSAIVLVDYCLLARVLSLLPWNRNERFSLGLVGRTIFSRPMRGSIQQRLADATTSPECACSLTKPIVVSSPSNPTPDSSEFEKSCGTASASFR